MSFKPIFDRSDNWIGIEESKEVSITEAALIRSRLDLQVYRTALEEIRDFRGNYTFKTNAGALLKIEEIATKALRSTSEQILEEKSPKLPKLCPKVWGLGALKSCDLDWDHEGPCMTAEEVALREQFPKRTPCK